MCTFDPEMKPYPKELWIQSCKESILEIKQLLQAEEKYLSSLLVKENIENCSCVACIQDSTEIITFYKNRLYFLSQQI